MNANAAGIQIPETSTRPRGGSTAGRFVQDFVGLILENWRNWICFISLIVLFCIVEYVTVPVHRQITERELSDLKFPKSNETVPAFIVPLCSILIPTSVYLIYYYSNRDAREFHDLMLGSLLSLVLTALTTVSLKVYVGRPRPDFIDRCFGGTNNISSISLPEFNCTTQDQDDVNEGRKSFPSGHSSWMMCSMSFLSLFLIGKFQVFNGRGRGWSLVLALIPVTFAAFVGLSRFHDYRHHWTDVITGFGIGMFFSSVVYCTYYPSPFKRKNTHVPLYKTQRIRDCRLYQAVNNEDSVVNELEKV